MEPVTLYDVADHTSVSYQTVSRVANQASHISAKIRQEVEAAMAELNYIPDRVAQQLAGKQTPPIGAATANLALHAPSQVVAAIKPRASWSGTSVVIATIERGGVESCKAAVHNLLSQHIAELIVNHPLDEGNIITVAAACGTAPVLFLDVSDLTPINSMIFSHDDDAHLDVEYLVWHGHQRITPLNGPCTFVSTRLRHVGWHKYLAHYQLQPVVEPEDDWSAVFGFQQMTYILNNGNLLTTMLIANDQVTLGAIWAISEPGLRAAMDILVIGYDDTEDSACYTPPLTTIRQDSPLLSGTSVGRPL